MKSKFLSVCKVVVFAFFIAGCAAGERNLSSFGKRDVPLKIQNCYDRKSEPYTPVVDSHIHFRPFGGAAVPFTEINEYFNKTRVRFASIYGIGQIVPVDSDCTYYLDCQGTPVLPSIKNDFVNAANYLEFPPKNAHLTLSMTFPDLANPETLVEQLRIYDKEYPGMFRLVGEVNIIKQALLGNFHKPSTRENIDQWADFMAILKERDIPVNFHSDLGHDEDNELVKQYYEAGGKDYCVGDSENQDTRTKCLYLMDYVLERYPDNKIIWAHMGLSKELTKLSAEEHIQIIKSLLDKSPNLLLDISWRVLEDTYFSNPEYRELYITFLNQYSDRILPGTDFVASRNKTFEIYNKELEVTSRIHQYLNDEAFRNIALGENYFRMLNLNYEAPRICKKK